MNAAQSAKLAAITARRQAEFAAVAQPVEPVEFPEPGGFEYIRRVRPMELDPRYQPREARPEQILEPRYFRYARAVNIDFTPAPEPRQAQPDYFEQPRWQDVLFDANLPYHRRHFVTFVAGDEVATVELPLADLNLGLAENAAEVRARLRSLYMKQTVERPLVLNGETDRYGNWRENPTDEVAFDFVMQYPQASLQLMRAAALYDRHPRVTMHVWDGMADEVAAVIESAAMRWHEAPAPVTSVTGSLKPMGFEPTMEQDPELVPVYVKQNRIVEGEIVSSEQYGLHDPHTNMLYFAEYVDSFDKTLDLPTKLVDALEVKRHYHMGSTWLSSKPMNRALEVLRVARMYKFVKQPVSRSVPQYEFLDNPELEGMNIEIAPNGNVRFIHQTARGTYVRTVTENDKLFFRGTLDEIVPQILIAECARTYVQARRQSELEQASPSRRQAMVETDKMAVPMDVVENGIKVTKPVDVSARRYEMVGEIDRIIPDKLMRAEWEAVFADWFETGRVPEAAEIQRIDHAKDWYVTDSPRIAFYDDGVLVDETERVYLSQMMRERVTDQHPNRIAIVYNVSNPYKTWTYMLSGDRVIHAPAGYEASRDRMKRTAAWFERREARLAREAEAAREAAAKAAAERKARQDYDIVAVSTRHRLAHDETRYTMYVGKTWSRGQGSVFANGPTRDAKQYKQWLWAMMKDSSTPVRQKLEDLAQQLRAGKPVTVHAWPDAPKDAPKFQQRLAPAYVKAIAAAARYLAAQQG